LQQGLGTFFSMQAQSEHDISWKNVWRFWKLVGAIAIEYIVQPRMNTKFS